MAYRALPYRLTASILALSLSAALAPAACGGSDESDATGGKGGSGAKGSGGGVNFDGSAASGGTTTLDPDAACAKGSALASLSDVNMLVMFDRSGSMNQNNKWPQASAALVAFFQDPGTGGLRVALRFFPDDQPASGCNDNDCSEAACSQPLVGIGELTAAAAPADTQEAALVGAVTGTAPGSGQGTPMYAALGGAETWATTYQTAHPAEKTAVVLVTDGMPNGCNEDIDAISGLAAAALASNGVLTYAVGLEGSNQAQMDQIAQAGGTTKGIFIGTSANAQAELLAALIAIKGQIVSCSFPMPAPSPGLTIDPGKINVNYTPGGGSATTLGQVASAADCGTAGGWYYDNPTTPTTITLCPATCTTVTADADAKIEILIGCATQVGSPA